MYRSNLHVRIALVLAAVMAVAMAASMFTNNYLLTRQIELMQMSDIPGQQIDQQSLLVLQHALSENGWSGIRDAVSHLADVGNRVLILDSEDRLVISPFTDDLEVFRNAAGDYRIRSTTQMNGEVSGLALDGLSAEQIVSDQGVRASVILLPPGVSGMSAHGTGNAGDDLARAMLRSGVIIGLASILMTIVGLHFLLRPVRQLRDQARRFVNTGELAAIDADAPGELGELGHAFNAMVGSLQHSRQVRRRIVADVAHELRTPLANLRARVEAVQSGIIAADEKFVGTAKDEILLLTKLVDDLQQLVDADTDALELHLERIALADFVQDLGQAVMPAGGNRLGIEIAPEIAIWADRSRLRQILVNLIENALAYGGDDVRITIAARPVSGGMEIEISDNGPGIPEQDLPFVFDRFFRVDRSRNREFGGAGLGLSIVKSLVVAHGGNITVRNRSSGGTAFRISWPER